MPCLNCIEILWAGAVQAAGVDFGGYAIWTEEQLWSKGGTGTSGGTADLKWKHVDLLKERALGRF